MTERKTQYERGWDDAIDAVLQVLAIAVETWPRVPTGTTLKLFMDPPTANLLLESVARFQDKFNEEASRRLGVEA